MAMSGKTGKSAAFLPAGRDHRRRGRDLWQFAESSQDFSDWIKGRIEKYSFVEGEDFTVHKFVERDNQGLSAGQGRIDYHLTIEMAKELAMVESNEKGRQVRCRHRRDMTMAVGRWLTHAACQLAQIRKPEDVAKRDTVDMLGRRRRHPEQP